jgi:nuclear pore complex protein Nup54
MAPPIEMTQQNPLCRFKAIGYSCMPSSDSAQGLVAITFNKKEEEIRCLLFMKLYMIIYFFNI